MLNIIKFLKGLRIIAKSASEADTLGEIEVLSSTNKATFHNGSSTSAIVTEAHTGTLTNKVIDLDNNTLSNIEVDNLKSGVLNTSSTLASATDSQVPSALAVKTITDAITADVIDDVEGPASSTSSALALYNGTTGKLLKDSTVTLNGGLFERPAGMTFFASAGDLIFTPASAGAGQTQFNWGVRHNNSVFRLPSTISTAGANITVDVGDKSTIVLTGATSIDMLIPYSSEDGQIVTLVNGTASPITINNETGASVGYRIRTGSGTSYVIPSTGSVCLTYVSAFSRWTLNGGNTALVDHLNDTVDAHDASAISVSPFTGVASTDVQSALQTLQTNITTGSGDASAALAAHIADTVDAHDASAISLAAIPDLIGDTVQAGMEDLTETVTDLGTFAAGLQTQVNAKQDTITGAATSITSANLTVSKAVVSDGSGKVAASATSAAEIGYVAGVTSAIQTQLNTKVAKVSPSTALAIPRFSNTSGDLQDSGVLALDGGFSTSVTNGDLTLTPNGTGKIIAAKGLQISSTLQSDIQNYNTSGDFATITVGSRIMRLTNAALTSIGTITAGAVGQDFILVNATGNDVTLLDTSSVGGNNIKTGTGASVTFKNNASMSFLYDSTSSVWRTVGGTASSGGGTTTTGASDVDALLIQNFDTATTADFTQVGLSLTTSGTLNGAQSALLTHQAVTTQYFKQTLSVAPKFRGVNLTAALLVRSTASEGNVTITVVDETNAVTLTTQNIQTSSQVVTGLSRTSASPTISGFTNTTINTLSIGMSVTGTGIPAGTRILSISTTAGTITLSANATATLASTASVNISALPKTVQLGFTVPANCLSLSYRISALADTGAETYIDDVKLSNYFMGTSIEGQSRIQVPVITNQSTYLAQSSTTGVATVSGAATSETGSGVYSYNSATGIYTMLVNANLALTFSGAGITATGQPNITVNGLSVSVTTAPVGAWDECSWSGTILAGQTFFFSNTAGSLANKITTVLATAYSTSAITTTDIVPAKAVLGNTTVAVPVVNEVVNAGAITITGSTTNPTKGTTTVDRVTYTRRGDMALIQYQYEQSAAGSNGSGTYIFSLPAGLTIDTTKLVVSGAVTNKAVGVGWYTTNNEGRDVVAVVNSSTTFSLGYSNATNTYITGSATLGLGSSAFAAFSFQVEVPILGWAATRDVVVSGTQSSLIQQADSVLRVNTGNGAGSTGIYARRFVNVGQSIGSDVLYADSATNGATFTIQTSGTYTISYNDSAAGIGTSFGLSLNASPTIDFTTLTSAQRLSLSTASTINYSMTGSWSGYLVAGDVIRAHFNATPGINNDRVQLTITKQGSLKVAAVNANQKMVIPTSELRFEGASTRGSTATAIVKFDTLAKIRGDAFTVASDATNGTSITMLKAGKLDINTSIYAVTGTYLYLSKNQAILTTTPVSSEVMSSSGGVDAADPIASSSASISVAVGDVIRVATSAAFTANAGNVLNLYFQEQEVQVSVSNTLPQFSQSDSSVRVDTANGYGSTGTKIRRFSNIRDNIGVDVVYADSATNGASFTALTSGIYNVSYSDNFSGAAFTGLSKNASSLTAAIDTLASTEILALSTVNTAAYSETVSWQGYLNAGDIVRPQTDGSANTSAAKTTFTMSKVGKPNVTGVNVTPFVNVPQPDSQSATLLTNTSFSSGATVTGTSTRANNSSIFSYNATTGIYTMLKKGTVLLAYSAAAVGAASISTNIYVDGTAVAYANSLAAATAVCSTSYTETLSAGQTFKFTVGTSAANNHSISVTASAPADTILTAPETFNSDTAAFAYSSTYTLATLANAPVGTYVTFTYALNTNTRTQTSGTPPTQASSNINADGLFIVARAYNAASVTNNPSAYAIQIGKGLKGVSLNIYKNSGKSQGGSLDYVQYNTAGDRGLPLKTYNEQTGILVIDAGLKMLATTTTSDFQYDDTSTQSSGYITINASKNPALTGMNLSTVAARGVQSSGQSIANTTFVAMTLDAAKTFDTHGALNAATGVFTAPENGYYQVNASSSITGSFISGGFLNTFLYKNGVAYSAGTRVSASSAASIDAVSGLSDLVYLIKGETIQPYVLQSSGATKTLIASTSYNFFSVVKTNIG